MERKNPDGSLQITQRKRSLEIYTTTTMPFVTRFEKSSYLAPTLMGRATLLTLETLSAICFMIDMKINKGNHTNSGDNLDSLGVLESAIQLSVQEEYFNLSKTIDFDNVDYKDVLKESENLFSENTSIETKRRMLILLAHLGTPESSRILEKYLKISEGDLRDWTLLSLKECRRFLESVLLKEDGWFISTGLGGKNNKLRYYFVVSSKEGLALTETHRNTLKKDFETISQKYNCEIEEINFECNYAMIGMLVPMDVAVGEIKEEGISECNKMVEFLFFRYYVTNVKKPNNEQVLNYLEEIRHEEE